MRHARLSHDNRVAIYSGDDARMEFVYKFVTQDKFDPKNREANRDLLDRGTLYVARFEANGKMRWLPLVHGQGPLTAANGFNSQADVVIEARRAGTLLGATPMDRPEDVEPNPLTGNIYVVMTFNERRTAAQIDAANPRAENKWGHIIEIVPPRVNGKPDHAATECDWGFFIVGGDPSKPEQRARYPNAPSANGWVAAPDNVAFDPKGRIWISTDGQEDAAGFNDSLYAHRSGQRQARRDPLFLHRPGRRRGVRARVHAGREDPVPRHPAPGPKARPSTSRPRAGRTSAPTCRRARRSWRSLEAMAEILEAR